MSKRHISDAIKYIVYVRDDHKCQHCLSRGSNRNRLTLHHVNHRPNDNRSENLIVLCQNCHTKLHKKFG